MTHSNEALSRLRGITLEDLTSEQMDSVLGPSSISPNINGQLEQAQSLANAVSAQRTYCGGVLPIPELGAVGQTDDIAAAGTGTIQPPGTELWQITGMMGTGLVGSAVIDVMWFDGTRFVTMVSQQTMTTAGAMIDINEKVSAPFILSNSLYLAISSASNAVQIKYAYHKVSL
jgi:hypothetical protein